MRAVLKQSAQTLTIVLLVSSDLSMPSARAPKTLRVSVRRNYFLSSMTRMVT